MEHAGHIMIITIGSRGDVVPYAGVGARLRAAGHRVTLAADRAFADEIRAAGLEFRALAGDVRAGARSEDHRDYLKDGMFSRSGARMFRAAKDIAREINRDVAEVAREGDILLLHGLASAGHHVAQARGIPSLSLLLQPNHPTSAFPPVLFPRSLARIGNRLAWAGLRNAQGMFFDSVNEIRADWGLPPTTLAATLRREAAADTPVLYGISEQVLPRPRDWRPGLRLTGYWWPVPDPDWQPSAELADFLAAGPPPVFVGFGSADPGDAQRIGELVMAALRETGQRGIVQAGWAGLAIEGDDMLTIGEVPHEWLFPRMGCVVHAAGAGVTAAGVRAGVPAVPVPMAGDQPFWSARLVSLGIAPEAIRFKHLTAGRLAAAIAEAVGDPAYRQRAGTLAGRVRAEDGARRVLETVEQLVPSHQGN